MFTRQDDTRGTAADQVAFDFEGREIKATAGMSLAAALMAAGVTTFRTSPVSGAPRAPYCMMGICFECLVVIDGVANQQACMIEVREAMSVARQRGAARIGPGHDNGAGESSAGESR